MAEQLDYESGIERANRLRIRFTARVRKLCVFGTAAILAAVVIWQLCFVPTSVRNVHLTLINNTQLPITDAGYCDDVAGNEQSGIFAVKFPHPCRLAALAPGESISFSGGYNRSRIRTFGFWYKQGEQTFRFSLDKAVLQEGQWCTITITPGRITCVSLRSGRPEGALLIPSINLRRAPAGRPLRRDPPATPEYSLNSTTFPTPSDVLL